MTPAVSDARVTAQPWFPSGGCPCCTGTPYHPRLVPGRPAALAVAVRRVPVVRSADQRLPARPRQGGGVSDKPKSDPIAEKAIRRVLSKTPGRKP